MFSPPVEVKAFTTPRSESGKPPHCLATIGGMRLSDAVSRNWREIDLTAEVDRLHPAKDRASRGCAASSRLGRSSR